MREKDWLTLRLVAYGTNNTYPQEALYTLRRCGIASACVDVASDFLAGNGFADPAFGGTVCNADGQTLDDVLELASYDYAAFNGFALLVNYNALGEAVSLHYVPFKDVRLHMPDEQGNYSKLRVWDNYAGESPRFNSYWGDIRDFYRFNPSTVLDEIEACGGIENYTGQVLYYTDSAGFYPLSSIDSVWQDVTAMAYYSDFMSNYIRNQFSASVVVTDESDIPNQEVRLFNEQVIAQMGGTANAGAIVYMQGKLNVQQMSSTRIAEDAETIYATLSDSIVQAFGIPQILVSRSRQGSGFPNADELVNAFNYYNGLTQKRRNNLSKCFGRVASIWQYDLPKNYAIDPKNFGA